MLEEPAGACPRGACDGVCDGDGGVSEAVRAGVLVGMEGCRWVWWWCGGLPLSRCVWVVSLVESSVVVHEGRLASGVREVRVEYGVGSM